MRGTLALLLLIPLLVAAAPDSKAVNRFEPWASFFEENEVHRLIQDVSARYRPGRYAITGVTVIDVATGERLPNRMVLVNAGRIEAVVDGGKPPRRYARIDGRGKFLVPGLVDMHVHSTTTDADTLLQLANGVTAVRDMCGFPWTLRLRERIRAGRVLMPERAVAGHLLSAEPLDIFATVVRNPEEARQVVRDQKAAGYEFIKVHNVMSSETYQAVLDEAARLDIRVVGHIPGGIPLSAAIQGGQRTIEHFKGYIRDTSPSPSLTSEDYVGLTRGAAVFNCPTFYTYRIDLHGEEARDLIQNSEEMRYISLRARRQWLAEAASTSGDYYRRVFDLSARVFRDLLPLHPRFLAGTDSGGGYSNMVPGFALLEELQTMEDLGLPPLEVLQAATLNAAAALERAGDMGAVEAGKRADLLLLDRDPLLTAANLRRPAGVMVRGIWLDRRALTTGLLGRLADLYRRTGADASLDNPSNAQVDGLIRRMEALGRAGWVFKDHQLETLAGMLQRRGREADAGRVLALGE
jgi:hypothetical protein